jgi:cysteine synthase A
VEILEGLDGRVDAWVTSVGSGGTLLGVTEILKAANPNLVVAGVVPDDDPRMVWIRSGTMHKVLAQFGMPKLRFIIEEILERQILDHELVVSNADAKHMADRLCQEEGLFCGMSSGANVYAAVQMAKELPKGARIATVLVDRRDRYFAEYPNEHYVV